MPGREVPVSLLFTLRFANTEFLQGPNKSKVSFALARLACLSRPCGGAILPKRKEKYITHIEEGRGQSNYRLPLNIYSRMFSGMF